MISEQESFPKLPPDLKFETALAELEALAQDMESGKLPLEESIEAYRRGMALLRHCQEQLSAAGQKIQVMEAGILKDWNPDAPEMLENFRP